MDTLSAYILAMDGRMNRNNFKIIDWKKVFETIKENDIKNAEVGLSGDFDETKGLLIVDGVLQYPLVDTSIYGIYLKSIWATPVLFDLDNVKEYKCYYEVGCDSDITFTEDYFEVDGIEDLIKDFEINKKGDNE